MRAFLFGFVVAIALFALAAYGAVQTGAVPARQDVKPGRLETWLARTSLSATVTREQPKPPYPYGPPSEADFVSGANLYVQNCAICHGTAHSNRSVIARGLAVKPPQFAKNGVDDDPEGKIYWNVEHGIRMTAMPAYDASLDEKSIWQLTYFLKHLPDLPPKAKAIFENPKLAPPPTPAPAESALPKGAAAST